jgi:hypothetical protein
VGVKQLLSPDSCRQREDRIMTHLQANEHDLAIEDFRNRLDEYTIHTPKPPVGCGRSYVRVSKLTEWLRSEVVLQGHHTTQASRLLEYAYHNWHGHGHAQSTNKAKLFNGENRCIIVFCILLKLGWGDLIHLFRSQQKLDKHLPIDLLGLKTTFAQIAKRPDLPRPLTKPQADDLAAAFDKEQWQFCPAKFDLDEYPDFHKNRIIPIYRKEKINMKGGTATLWQIEVLEEFVGDNLKEVVKTALYNDDKDPLGPVSRTHTSTGAILLLTTD